MGVISRMKVRRIKQIRLAYAYARMHQEPPKFLGGRIAALSEELHRRVHQRAYRAFVRELAKAIDDMYVEDVISRMEDQL